MVDEYQDHSRSLKAHHASKSSPKGRTFFERILIGITRMLYNQSFQ